MPSTTVIEVFERVIESGIATYSAKPARRVIVPASRQIITIGSGSASDLQLPDKSVSRYHAVVVRGEKPEEAYGGLLRDLSTGNGTFAPYADVRIDQLTFQCGVTAYIGPYRLDINLDGEVEDWDRLSYSNAWDCTAPAARSPGTPTSRQPGRVEPLVERHPAYRDLILEAERHVGRTRHRRTILDWLVRSVAHRLAAPDSVLRIQCGRQVYAATPTFIDAPDIARSAINQKRPFVRDHLLIVPLLEGDLAGVAGEWAMKRSPSARAFTDDDARFLIALAEWVLAECPAGTTEQRATLPARRWPIAIAGASASFRKMMDEVGDAGNSSLSVLLTGPVGSGKTKVAEAIHRFSGRQGKFVEANAATGDPLTAEFLMFGGRLVNIDRVSRPGKLEEADRGSLFLDEVADMPERTQNMLKASTGDTRNTELRFHRILEEKGVERASDVRIIVATSKDLDALVKEGKFDDALLSRLKGRVIRVPPLEERRDDILLLAHFFLDSFAARHDEMPLCLSQAAKAAIDGACWAANVRGLGNAMEAAYERVIQRRSKGVVAGSAGQAPAEMAPVPEAPPNPGQTRRLVGDIQLEDLNLGVGSLLSESPTPTAPASLREAVMKAVLSALRKAKGDRQAALDELGTTETTLNQTLDNWCIPRAYGKAEPNFTDSERSDKERILAAMAEVNALTDHPLRWGLAPKDLKVFYESVMDQLVAVGVRFVDLEGFIKRLDELWIPRHYPSTTDGVRNYWRRGRKHAPPDKPDPADPACKLTR